MYAVIATGGKQYRVQPGDTVRVEKLAGTPGQSIEFTDVLLVANDGEVRIGTPHVAGANVVGEVVAEGRGPKLITYKFRRRKGYRRKTGHRQSFTAIKISAING